MLSFSLLIKPFRWDGLRVGRNPNFMGRNPHYVNTYWEFLALPPQGFDGKLNVYRVCFGATTRFDLV